MSNFTYPSSPLAHERRNQWTVSPEFGDALLTAMRERSLSGAEPLPRLPSLLQLPTPTTPPSTQKPISSTVSSNSTERLKMKTRITVRDESPHRFQVVPLRDINAPSHGNALPAKAQRPMLKQKKSLLSNYEFPLNPRPQPVSENRVKCRPNENKVLYNTRGSIKTDTPERGRTLSERDNNVLVLAQPTLHVPTNLAERQTELAPASATTTRRVPMPSNYAFDADSGNTLASRRQCKELNSARSSLRTRSSADQGRPGILHHFRSPSLGNLSTEPAIVPAFDISTLPRSSFPKRTNTLSADCFRCSEQASLTGECDTPGSQPPATGERHPSKRHAIYTQSLYVPHTERSSLAASQDFGSKRSTSLDVRGEPATDAQMLSCSSSTCIGPDGLFPYPSKIPTSLSKRKADNTNALGSLNLTAPRFKFRSPSGLHWDAFESDSSLSSFWSQDDLSLASQAALIETRPLVCSRTSDLQRAGREDEKTTEKTNSIVHHPILVSLLAEVEKVMLEWSAM